MLSKKSRKLLCSTKSQVVASVPKDRPADAPPLFERQALLDRTKLRKGDLFSRSQVAMDVQAIADRYRESEDSAVASDLDGAERTLLTGRAAVVLDASAV